MALAAPCYIDCSFSITMKKRGSLANRHHQGHLAAQAGLRCSGRQAHTKNTKCQSRLGSAEKQSQRRGWGSPCYFFLQLIYLLKYHHVRIQPVPLSLQSFIQTHVFAPSFSSPLWHWSPAVHGTVWMCGKPAVCLWKHFWPLTALKASQVIVKFC